MLILFRVRRRALSVAAGWLVFAGCTPPSSATPPLPGRVVSTAPGITEMIYALGAEQQLVGVTTYCEYPPAALEKPRIGSFAAPSVEAVLAQEPDLVITLSDRQDIQNQFRSVGLPVLMLDNRNLDSVLNSIEKLGDRLGRAASGRRLADRLRSQLQQRRSRFAGRPRREVLVLVGRNPGSVTDLYAVGSSSYLADLVEAAGGRSLFRDAAALYPKVSIEEILVRDPELILDLSQMGQQFTPRTRQQIEGLWKEFPSLEAVRNDRVFILNDDVLLVPGPRMIEGVDRLIELFEGGHR